MSEHWVKHSLTHIGKFRSPGDNGLLSTLSCLRTDFLHSLGRRGECNVRAYLYITPLNPSIHIQILQTKRHAISNLPGERRSKKWLTKRHNPPPPLPPWKASFLSDKIIGKKKTDFRSWTPQLRIIFVLNFILLCETTSSAPSKRHFHTEPSQAFEREGKRSFRRERNAGVSLPPSLLKRPSRFAFRVSPFPFPFKRLPRSLYSTPGSRLPYSEPYPFVPKLLITILLFVAVVPEPVHVCLKGVWHDGWRNWV